MIISMVRRCHETETQPIEWDEVLNVIRDGSHGLKGRITQIRNRYEVEKDITGGDVDKAKKAVADLKLQLPGFRPSGTFSKRENGCLVEYSGILCADLDSLGDKLTPIRNTLKDMPFIRAIALSPSGDGLKVFFNVINDPARHEDSFRNIKIAIRESLDVEIDEKCKDLARICFFTYDPDLWVRTDGNEIFPPADPLPKPMVVTRPSASMTTREQIAFGLLGELQPSPEKDGYFVRCPGESFHSNKTGTKHTILYLQSVPTLSCQHQSCAHVVESFNKVLRSEIGKAEFVPEFNPRQKKNGQKPEVKPEPDEPLIEFFSPSEIMRFEIPDSYRLVGDNHINMASIVVLGGAPDVGKSLAGDSLAYAGANGEDWMGYTTHRKFRTLIIQNENGPSRLKSNFVRAALDTAALDDWIRICKPPPYGFCFKQEAFRTALKNYIDSFKPQVVVIDPFTAMVYDQDSREYLMAFETLLSVLPKGDERPALFIIAHTRKPQTDERASGRALLKMLAGSFVLGSVPRTAFVLQAASDDTEDNRVVITCCKNNDGEKGKRSAWRHENGLFSPEPNFSWAEFDACDKDKRVVITEDMMNELFKEGWLPMHEARKNLEELSGAARSTVYNALSPNGRFGKRLIFNKKEDKVGWIS